MGEGGEYQDFPSKKFSLTVPNISLGHPVGQCFRNFLVAKKFLDKGGGIKIFRRKIFLSQCRKISQGNLLLLH